MTGFFNPQGFLTAMRQEVTRAHKGWALDSVVLHNDVNKHMKEDITSAPSVITFVDWLIFTCFAIFSLFVRLVRPHIELNKLFWAWVNPFT